MNNRTEAKLTDLSGMQKAIEEILKQAWERGRKYGQNEERSQGKTNADLFKQTFGLYATEVWAMSESQFLEWLNSKNDCKEANDDT